MDISMFFVFPGILITLGVILLILSIILLIIAFKTNDNSIVEAKGSNLDNAPVVNNDSIVSIDKTLEVNNVEDNKKQDSTATDNGFDLTKVFEISPEKGLIEKENISNNKSESDIITSDEKKDEVDIKPNDNDNEDIELL